VNYVKKAKFSEKFKNCAKTNRFENAKITVSHLNFSVTTSVLAQQN